MAILLKADGQLKINSGATNPYIGIGGILNSIDASAKNIFDPIAEMNKSNTIEMKEANTSILAKDILAGKPIDFGAIDPGMVNGKELTDLMMKKTEFDADNIYKTGMMNKQVEQMRLDAEHKAEVLKLSGLDSLRDDTIAGYKAQLALDTFNDTKKTNETTRNTSAEELKQLKMTTEEAKEAKALANIEARISTSLETTSPEMLSSIINVANGETLSGNIAKVLGIPTEEVEAMTPAMREAVRIKADSMFTVKIEQNDRALVNMVDKVIAGKEGDRELTDASNALDQALMDKTTVEETDLARNWAMDATKGGWNTVGNALSNTWDGLADTMWRDDTTTKIADLEAEKNMLEKGIQNGSIKGKFYQRDGTKVPVEVDAKEYAIERLKGLNTQLKEIKAISSGVKGVALTKQVKVMNDALKELKDKKVTDTLIKKFLKDIEETKKPKKKNKKQ